MSPLERQVEALLFLSPDPLSVVELAELTGAPPGPVQRALAALGVRHGPETGLELAEVAGGFALRTRADLREVADRLRGRPREDRLSPAALETLAVVAYLEPVTRREIGRLRGVQVDHTVATLVERGLIEEAGPGERGSPTRYRTTRRFQERFGLRSRADLPPVERFALTGDQAEDLRRRLSEAALLAEPETPEA